MTSRATLLRRRMSATVKLAKEMDEPSDIRKPSAECQFRGLPGESWLHERVRGGAQGEQSVHDVRPTSTPTSPIPFRAACADDQASADHRETVQVQKRFLAE